MGEARMCITSWGPAQEEKEKRKVQTAAGKSRRAEEQRSRGAEEQRSRAAKLCFGGRPSVAEYEAAMAGGNKRQKRKDGVEGAV